MSTLPEIESAVRKLPRREQELLYQQLAKRLGGGPSCYDLARELFEEPGWIGASGKSDLSCENWGQPRIDPQLAGTSLLILLAFTVPGRAPACARHSKAAEHRRSPKRCRAEGMPFG